MILIRGLFSETDDYISSPSSYPRMFVSGSTVGLLKTYFNQIRNKSVLAGDSYYWKGMYSWFDQNEYILKPPNDIQIENNENYNLISYENAIGAVNYKIYRSDKVYTGFTLIGNSTTLNYSDTDIDNGNKYFYYVIADNLLK